MADPPGLRHPFPGLKDVRVENLGFRSFSEFIWRETREEEAAC